MLKIFPKASVSTRVFSSLVTIAAVCNPVGLSAQDVQPSSARLKEGRVIYSRDVPYGSSIGPRTPSVDQSVVTGPTNLLLSTIATGLKPLGDDENAGVVATTNLQTGLPASRVQIGMEALTGRASTGPSTLQNGSIHGSVTGSAVGQATGAIRDAMGSLRNVLGGGK